MVHEEAERLLRVSRHGVLSTLSKRHDGWPFGSIAPYAVSKRGEPLILIAGIAEHTKNIVADDRVSLLVQEDGADGDPQARGRLTLLGRAKRIGQDEDHADARARYLARVPGAESYFATHDFDLFRIGVEHVRYIGGFGKIHWLDPEPFRVDPSQDPLAPGAKGVIDHMNADHRDVLFSFCRVFRGVSAREVEMVAVDRWGFDVTCRAPDARLRFDFDEPASPENIRRLMVELTKRARKLEAGAGPT